MTEPVKNILAPLLSIILMVPLALLLSNCTSPEPRYYSLTPSASAQGTESQSAARTLSVEVDQVNVPQRLKQSKLLLAKPDGTLTLTEQARWTSPLPDEIHDALTQQVQTMLQTCNSYQPDSRDPQRMSMAPEFRVSATLVRMDAVLGGRFNARLNWGVQRGRDKHFWLGGTILELSMAQDINAIVNAMQGLMASSARDIADTICANAV